MKRLFFLCIFFVPIFSASGQNTTGSIFMNVHDLEKQLAEAKTPIAKTDALISLYLYHSQHNEPANKKAAQEYQQQLEIFTNETNDPELIARMLSVFITATRGAEFKKRVDRLYEFAKLHEMPFYIARAKIRESSYAISFESDHNKAVQLITDAVNLTRDLNDSLRIVTLLQVSTRFNEMNDHLEALHYAFQAQELALQIHSLPLLLSTNSLFESIYRKLKNYNKAIEYNQKGQQYARLLNKPHIVAFGHAIAASSYFMLDQPILGNYHVKEAYRIADSVKGSKRLYNEIAGAITGVLSRSNHDNILIDFLDKYRKYFFINPVNHFLDYVTLARAYAKVGNVDSARRLITKATEFLSEKENPNIRMRYFYTLARIASYEKHWDTALADYRNALQIALAQNDLDYCIEFNDSLKNILVQQNRLPQALHQYNLGDSLQAELAKQADKEAITRQEVAGLEKEKQLQALEKEKEKNQRHNLQYLGITFGVVALFILLILMGLFKISPKIIKILSFFSFLLFFEFMFLMFKKQIAVFTHGEPWKDLAFMVLLAAVMVPLHHWGEHKVVEYLSSKKLSFGKRMSLRKPVAKKEVLN